MFLNVIKLRLSHIDITRGNTINASMMMMLGDAKAKKVLLFTEIPFILSIFAGQAVAE